MVCYGVRVSDEVIGTEGVSKQFGLREVLRGVTLSLPGPGVIGVLGPNGAGKTTLLEILEGLSEPTSGAVRLFGEPLRRGAYPRRRVGVVMQREFVFDGITVREYAELFAAIQGVPGAGEVLRDAGLEGREATPVARLSGGQAQRLFIAAAAVHRPALLFLDEPTAHLDPSSKRVLGRWIHDLGRERTVLLTTHDLREAEALCDRVVFLVDGQVRAVGRPAELIDALPPEARGQGRLEDAFFHLCDARIDRSGGLLVPKDFLQD